MKVVFKEAAPCSGFDPTLSPPWLMVPEDGANAAVAEITPAAAADWIAFEVADTGRASVSPSAAASEEQTLTLSGVSAGETELRAKVSGTDTVLAALGLSVKERVTKSVCIHAVTEGNDDAEIVGLGLGQPNQPCVSAGLNGVLDTVPAGNDAVAGNAVTTGPNGICQTAVAGDDVQVIPVNQGKPGALCVGPGANGFVDSRVQGDDALTAGGITTGPDGICDTLANHYDLPPANCPSAAELAAYLNDVWGKQANVWFTVTRSDCTVNYDLDRSGTLAHPNRGAAPNPAEAETISAEARDNSVDYNIYYVYAFDYSIGTTSNERGETLTAGEGRKSVIHDASFFPVCPVPARHLAEHSKGRSGHALGK
jgi:hypothetical protein